MGSRTLLLHMFAFTVAHQAWADPHAISAVARALPSPVALSLPSLPNPQPTKLARAETSPLARDITAASLDAHRDLSAFGLPCGTDISAEIAGEAMYRVKITDPCRPHQSVALNVDGLRFDVTLSTTGSAKFDLPAMQDSALLETEFTDGTHVSTPLPALDLSDQIRLAVAWNGSDDVTLSADRLPLTTIGESKNRLQVLSTPRTTQNAGLVRLAILRHITAENCEQPAKASLFRQHGTGEPMRYDLTLAGVSCSRVGETLELKNVLEDLKLAGN